MPLRPASASPLAKAAIRTPTTPPAVDRATPGATSVRQASDAHAEPLVPQPGPEETGPKETEPREIEPKPRTSQSAPTLKTISAAKGGIAVGQPSLAWSPSGLEVRLQLRNFDHHQRQIELELVIKKNLKPQVRLKVPLLLQANAIHNFSHLFSQLPKASYTVTHFVRDR
jgi:hypothetical protein